MKFSVIIPTTLTRNAVFETIKSINNQSFKDFEIILSTNKQKIEDNIINRLGKKVKIIKTTKSGLSHAKNKGIKEAKGEIISFLDDDAIANENWLQNLSKSFSNKKIGIVGGPIYPIWPKTGVKSIKNSSLAKEWLSLIDISATKIFIDRIFGCNFSVKRNLFSEFGLFSTQLGRRNGGFLGGEDTEFCNRIKKKYKILYNPDVIISHIIDSERLTLKWIYKRAYYGGYSKAFQKKFPKRVSKNSKFKLFDLTLLIPYLIGYGKGFLERL